MSPRHAPVPAAAPALAIELALAIALALTLGSGCRGTEATVTEPVLPSQRLDYPDTRRDEGVADDYFGTRIPDPYRWLEDDRSAQTAAWVAAENAVTRGYLDAIPFRKTLHARLEQLFQFERFGVPTATAGHLYYTRNDGQQDQAVLYREPAAGGAEELVLDPNTFSDDNTASLAGFEISPDDRHLAYERSEGGSDWQTVRVLDLADLTHATDSLAWVKFSGLNWWRDGFFYSRYPTPDSASATLSDRNEGHQLYYHRLGTPQTEDRLVYEDPAHPQRNVGAAVTHDERYLVVSRSGGTSGNAVSVATLGADGSIGPLRALVAGFDDDYYLVGEDGARLLFWTNAGAPNGRVVGVDPTAGEPGFADVIAEDPDRVLKSVTQHRDRLFATYLHDVSSEVEVRRLDGTLVKTVPLPGIGTVAGVSARREGGDAYFGYSSFTTPGAVYRLDSVTYEPSVWRASENGFDASRYVTKQVRYKSKDGTEVPMFIIYREGLVLDGERPTLLYGYGGFDISIQPQHAVMRLDLFSPILEQGGVCAVANIRGGGEYGSDWHEAGTEERKQNVFDDFIAAAEYLQEEGYTSPARTAIYGRSNGGLLVGACLTQRPDLFGVAFPAVGVLDMLRYHQFTIGWAWASDYGRADSSAAAFEYLRAYSPLHNIERRAYPATLVTTADHDDRVVPAHSFKFAAELQRSQSGTAPILLRVDESSGHGSGKPLAKQVDEATDVLAFMFYRMRVDYQAP